VSNGTQAATKGNCATTAGSGGGPLRCGKHRVPVR